jgi:hypothetical protein
MGFSWVFHAGCIPFREKGAKAFQHRGTSVKTGLSGVELPTNFTKKMHLHSRSRRKDRGDLLAPLTM